MKYFAYGSNMLEERLRSRAPSAVFVGVGILESHPLCLYKRGRDGSDKGNREQSRDPADPVYGG